MRLARQTSSILARGLAWAALTLFAQVQGAAQAASPAPYDADGWRADYAQLKHILEKDYANLAWFGSPEGGVDLPRLDARTQEALRSARSDAEARQALVDFVQAFRGGHFSVQATLAAASAASAPVPRPALDAADPSGSCAAIGILPTARIAFSLPLESLPGFHLLADGQRTVFRAGLVASSDGQKIGVIRIQNFTVRAFPAACVAAVEVLAAKGATLDAGSLRTAAQDDWRHAFVEQIATLRAAGMTTLLVDVGNDSGGDDNGDLFPRLLTDRAVHSARLLVTADSAGQTYAQEQLDELGALIDKVPPKAALDALTQARDFFAAAKRQTTADCDLGWVWTERRPWSGTHCKRLVDVAYAGGFADTLPRSAFGDPTSAAALSYASNADALWGAWTGPLYVLTDGETYSSAEMFSAVVQDNRIGRTVGVRTGGDGCGFMAEQVPATLAHSRMRLRIPNCVRLRADGSNEVTGIAPDIPVLPTEGEDSRQRASRLIEAVAADRLQQTRTATR